MLGFLAEPVYLWCFVPLILLGGLLFILTKRQNAAVKRLGAPNLVAKLSASVNWKGRRWQTWLFFIALVLVVISLARPRWGSQVEYIERRGVEVMVALDVSASMLAEDFKPNRLARAKLEISELMDRLEGNELGLVLFSGAAFIQFPLTSDFSTARTFLDAAYPTIISRPGTDIAAALRVAIQGFNEDRATQKVIILLTDGENHRTDVFAAAQEAADVGIIVYTIGFGSPDGEPIPVYDSLGELIEYKTDRNGETVLSRLDETTLQEIALMTNGAYFRAAPDGREVNLLINEIDRLQTSELESRFETRGVERFQWFLGLAIVALIVKELIPDRLRSVSTETARS
ncbi:MAG TPA: VWA domain-containing protein [Anaerolineae bacterium]|nr:VWA domain-containing protein [Anaerolineae bacterium]HMR63475.1 VWA domain-containing protein [Anaerolineae bacterium]